MLARLRLGFRALWMALATLFLSAMMQFANEGAEPLLTGRAAEHCAERRRRRRLSAQ